jgi:hypothetical protein
MRIGEPESDIANFIDRINKIDEIPNVLLETLAAYRPRLPYKPEMIDWSECQFGPGSFSNTHKKDPALYSSISKLRMAISNPVDFCKSAEVPKTFKKPRLIAAHALNELLQQYPVARALMRETQKASHGAIRYHDQDWSRIHCTTQFDSLDQSTASDLVRDFHVAWAMPEWHPLLNHVRTKYVMIKGTKMSLATMFATMGSPLTFPTETWVFYSFTYAIMAMCGASKEDLALIIVYGDDILVPHPWGPIVIYFMELLGFKPNASKSFFREGEPFRETCGAETYHDRDITPARMPRGATETWYLGFSIPQMASLVSNFTSRGAWITAEILTEYLFPIESEDCISTPRCSGVWKLRKDYNDLSPLLRTVGINDEDAQFCVDSPLSPYTRGGHDRKQYYPPYKKDKSIAHIPGRIQSPITISQKDFYANNRRFWRLYWNMKICARRSGVLLTPAETQVVITNWMKNGYSYDIRGLFPPNPGSLCDHYDQYSYRKMLKLLGETPEKKFRKDVSK